ncbi:hypothetical protein GCM10022404_19660 [Celeribacter arenosi]|uniref:Uncharacterized protein n=1 Tax=Celeribacter arenosi TaxID=792649 RepID=A0ABP7K901_9RHOB
MAQSFLGPPLRQPRVRVQKQQPRTLRREGTMTHLRAPPRITGHKDSAGFLGQFFNVVARPAIGDYHLADQPRIQPLGQTRERIGQFGGRIECRDNDRDRSAHRCNGAFRFKSSELLLYEG